MTVMDVEQTDGSLVAEARRDVPGAFDQLVGRHFQTIYAIAWMRLFDREAAEELAQEVFLRAWLKLDKLRDANTFGGWAASMARNLAVDWKRKQVRSSKLISLVPMESTVNAISDKQTVSARDSLATKQEQRLVDEALALLTHEDRELIKLHYTRDLSHREIGRRLGIHHTTVARRIERALGELRRIVKPDAEGENLHSLQPRSSAAFHACAIVAAAATLSPSAKAALIAAAGSGTSAAVAGTGGGIGSLLANATPGAVVKILAGGVVVAGLGAGTWYAAIRSANSPAAAPAVAVQNPRPASAIHTITYRPGSELVFRLKENESAHIEVEQGNIDTTHLDFTRLDDKFTRVEIVWKNEHNTHYMLPFDSRPGDQFNAPGNRQPCEFDFLFWYGNDDGYWETLSVLKSEPEPGVYEYSLHVLRSEEFHETSQKWFDEYFQGRMSIREAQRNWLDDAEKMGVLPPGDEHRRRYREARHTWNP